MAKRIDILSTAFIFALAAGFLVLLDQTFAVTLYLGLTIPYVLFWIGIGMLLLCQRSTAWRVALVGLWIATFISLYGVNWDSRKPFLRAFSQIEPGMTAAQVNDLLGGYATGHYTSRTLEGNSVSYQHTLEGWGNSDFGVVYFDQSGRVASTQFLLD